LGKNKKIKEKSISSVILYKYLKPKPQEGDTLMELIIQEIIQKIISCFEIELEKLIMERRDISEFILATKKMFWMRLEQS
jgi:hypothetical protein